MNMVNTHARRAKGVVTSMPEGRGVCERLPPKGRASMADAAVEYTRKGVHWRRRYELRNTNSQLCLSSVFKSFSDLHGLEFNTADDPLCIIFTHILEGKCFLCNFHRM